MGAAATHEDQHGPEGKQAGRPARQDTGAERRDAKQQAAEYIPKNPASDI